MPFGSAIASQNEAGTIIRVLDNNTDQLAVLREQFDCKTTNS